MKYEFTITEKKHGLNQMRSGIIISAFSVCIYLYGWFHPKEYSDHLLTISISMIGILIGILVYRGGEKDRKLDRGLWAFRVNQNGVYLSTPDGLNRHIELDKISAFEEVRIDGGDSDYYYYILVQEDLLNFDLYLPINIDFSKIKEVLGHHGITILDLSYKSKRAYQRDLELKGRIRKKFNEGFEF